MRLYGGFSLSCTNDPTCLPFGRSMHASTLNHTSPRHVALRKSQYASCIMASSYAHPGALKYFSFLSAKSSRSNGKYSSERSISASALTYLGSKSSYVSGSSASSSSGVDDSASSFFFNSSEALASSGSAAAAAFSASASAMASSASATASASTSSSSSSITSASASAFFDSDSSSERRDRPGPTPLVRLRFPPPATLPPPSES
mmetsp:Transcript_4062/g.18484  ORF Transcript_4062/g.18484 Transcript_4062/m.18484 type:complete len:204 (-) Transcript_4062:1147-1758(-)